MQIALQRLQLPLLLLQQLLYRQPQQLNLLPVLIYAMGIAILKQALFQLPIVSWFVILDVFQHQLSLQQHLQRLQNYAFTLVIVTAMKTIPIFTLAL